MLIVISPAKTLDYDTPAKTKNFTQPDYLDRSQQLIDRLREMSSRDIAELMNVSTKIADLNFDRYESWRKPFTVENAKQAILAFKGDVYTGLDAETFTAADFKFSQNHLRVLSGLYGLLRPLDLMQPYRLEMGTRLTNQYGKNLYEFWGTQITEGLNQQLKKLKSEYLINLASNEYFKSVKPKHLHAEIITPEFKDYKNGQYKMLGVYAKRARGAMSRFIIQNKLVNPEDIKSFSEQGYAFNKKLSKDNHWIFTRKASQVI
ncbi:MAG: peroxide stress protein YaaA [Gammaproteobacteria bacterium]|nr:peroxide stress protein YaaA [Gammaproteobacteria bacterium]MDH5734687.1 peroxide stress protein YaaA [Gammaproteobacteria bacterium]